MFGTPKEVRDTLAAISEAKKQLHHIIGVGDLWNEARRLARIKHDTIDAIRNEGWTAEQLSWQLIANVAWEYLVTGRFHTYRGIVGLGGKGLPSVFNECMRRLVALGKLSEEEARIESNRLFSEIRKVG